MRRRTFIELAGLGTIGAMAGCAESRTLPSDAGPSPGDASADPDAYGADDAYVATDASPSAPFVLATALDVLLNDPSCSGHDHGFSVGPATYLDDTPLSFEGGSHLVAFRPSELVRIARGEQLPFATIGPGPGHGHCGLAFQQGLYVPSRDRVDACNTMSPPDGPQAVCEMRPQV